MREHLGRIGTPQQEMATDRHITRKDPDVEMQLAVQGAGERISDTSLPRLLFMRDLRHLLSGLGDDTLYALLASGEISARKIGGKWVTTPEAVHAWLEQLTAGKATVSQLQVVR